MQLDMLLSSQEMTKWYRANPIKPVLIYRIWLFSNFSLPGESIWFSIWPPPNVLPSLDGLVRSKAALLFSKETLYAKLNTLSTCNDNLKIQLEKNKLLTHATIWMNVNNRHSEKSLTQQELHTLEQAEVQRGGISEEWLPVLGLADVRGDQLGAAWVNYQVWEQSTSR